MQTRPARYRELKHPIKDIVVDFGKYAPTGMTWGDVPRDYIEMLLASERQKVEAFEEELKRRDLVQEAEVPMAMRLLLAGRNALAQIHHPDREGGTDKEMREVLAAYEALKELVTLSQQPT